MEDIERNGLLVSTTRLTVRPENRKEFFQTITPLMRMIESENGCSYIGLFEETKDENSFVVIGEWDTRLSWDAHMASDNYAVFQCLTTQLSVQSKTHSELLVPAKRQAMRKSTN